MCFCEEENLHQYSLPLSTGDGVVMIWRLLAKHVKTHVKPIKAS
jgi:hypothetical protein